MIRIEIQHPTPSDDWVVFEIDGPWQQDQIDDITYSVTEHLKRCDELGISPFDLAAQRLGPENLQVEFQMRNRPKGMRRLVYRVDPADAPPALDGPASSDLR